MLISTDYPPWWYSLSHHRRYRKLQQIRKLCCRRYKNRSEDRSGKIIHLDGTWIEDIPSFYLALGDAIHGRYGYFGACLDSLSDCLCGGFGVLPPLTIYLSNFDKVRDALDGHAWQHFHAENTSYDNSEIEYSSYFDALLEGLTEHGAELLPAYPLYNGVELHPTRIQALHEAQSVVAFIKDGVSYQRVRYGEESLDWGAQRGELCHDCSACSEQFHALGCDVERCPLCDEQALCCDHDWYLSPPE